MQVVLDSLQQRRMQFAKVFFALPLIFLSWGLLNIVWTNAVYNVAVVWPPDGSGISYWTLLAVCFVAPILIGVLLERGAKLDREPLTVAVVILCFIGLLLLSAITGYLAPSGRTFIELFLAFGVVLAYCVALLHMRHVPVSAPIRQEELIIVAPQTANTLLKSHASRAQPPRKQRRGSTRNRRP